MRLTVIQPPMLPGESFQLSPVVIDEERRIWQSPYRPPEWRGPRRWRPTRWWLMPDDRTQTRTEPSS